MSKEEISQMHHDIAALGKLIQLNESQRDTFQKEVKDALSKFQPTQTFKIYNDITTELRTADNIQLDSYKTLPEFNGDKQLYRSWREQIVKRMNLIKNFKTEPKYEAALAIIRSKITGSASDVLINNNTVYNIDAIIDRLDFAYADQRPLYVIEAEMTSIKQSNKSLQEYFDKINQALNMVITKIVMTYKDESGQKSLIKETQQKAVRTFIMGLKNPMIRATLYGHTPQSLTDAFAIAQTVFYDNQYLQLDQSLRNQLQIHPQNQQKIPPMNFNPNDTTRFNQPKKFEETTRPEPMDIDNSNRFKFSTNWRPFNLPAKREIESGRTQQPQKVQRINQLPEPTETEHHDYIPDDLLSQTSEESSAFLGE